MLAAFPLFSATRASSFNFSFFFAYTSSSASTRRAYPFNRSSESSSVVPCVDSARKASRIASTCCLNFLSGDAVEDVVGSSLWLCTRASHAEINLSNANSFALVSVDADMVTTTGDRRALKSFRSK